MPFPQLFVIGVIVVPLVLIATNRLRLDVAAILTALALALARQPSRLSALRTRLAQNRLTTPLFDTQRLCRDLETAYTQMRSS